MTREEATNILYGIRADNLNLDDAYTKDKYDALEMAVKALEQESVIDKIRAEIAQLTIAEGGDDYVRKMAELFSLKVKVLQIIDKYKAEQEET